MKKFDTKLKKYHKLYYAQFFIQVSKDGGNKGGGTYSIVKKDAATWLN